MARKVKFSDGRKGAALPVRVIPRASRNEIVEILADQTVKVRLISSAEEQETNSELIGFLSEVLKVPPSKLEIVAGSTGRDKLISILDITSTEVNQRILGYLP